MPWRAQRTPATLPHSPLRGRRARRHNVTTPAGFSSVNRLEWSEHTRDVFPIRECFDVRNAVRSASVAAFLDARGT